VGLDHTQNYSALGEFGMKVLQNAEQQDADQGYSRDRKLQLAYLPQVSEFSELDLGL